MTTKFQIKHVANTYVDNTQETLVPSFEFTLVKYLYSNHGGVLDGAAGDGIRDFI